MKTLQIILILSLIWSCFTQDDECTTQFETILQQKCNSILTSTCRFTDNLSQRCLPKNTCESVQSRDSCIKTIPEDFHKKKCIWDTTEANPKCKEVDKECADYNNYVNSYQISGDVCSDLSAGNNAKHCVLISEAVCESHYKECTNSNLNRETSCNANIPLNQPVKWCKWTGSGTCSEEKRNCDDVPVTRYHDDKTVCPQLNSDTGKKCIYDVYDVDLSLHKCVQQFISCSSYFASGYPERCNGKTPLNSNGNDYDYKYICKYITGTGGAADSCTAVPRTCEQYDGDDASVCISLTPTEQNKQNKRCVFDTDRNHCKEEYTNCELYATNEIEKDRDGCEDLIMLEENKKCVYIPEDDKCETRQIYENCEAYQGDDRKICESIISPTTNSYCVLDKDSKCKDRVPYCSEIPDGNAKDCIYYAKPRDGNKRCAYNATITPTPGSGGSTPTPTPTGPRCYEEYARCEDYLGNDTAICEGIRLYNGLTCEFVSGRCRSTNKNCEQALTEEECKLINVTGVSDKEKKVCDYVGTSCIENYKYCSDFRTVLISGTTGYSSAKTTCTNIKPYDESGNNIDIYSKCIYESGVGCQRVPKDCRDASSNPILCNLISPKIKDNSVKYCAFTGGSCKEQFKNCEDITGNFASSSSDYFKCVNNIIEGYITNECLVDTSTPPKCMKKNECYSFSEGSYAELCKSINPNCTYSPLLPSSSSSSPSPSVCHKTTYNCANTKFYTENEQNEAICKSIEASVPHKICVLKEDKTGCEEIYRESPYSSGTSSSQDSNSSSCFITKGINIILALLCLIF